MTNDRLKIAFGFGLLVILSVLAAVIALGKVEQSTSYGLLPIITALATLSGSFANWAFGQRAEQNVGKVPDAKDEDGGEEGGRASSAAVTSQPDK